jgi:hypothetical protein
MKNLTPQITDEFIELIKQEEFTFEGLPFEDLEYLLRRLVQYGVNQKQIETNSGAFLNDLIQKINDNK